MKKLISCALLFIIIFNLTACFDTDDLFDKVVTPEGSVPENTEKSTVIAPTEELTEKQTEEIIEAPTEEIPTDEERIVDAYGGVTIKKTSTFTPVIAEADYENADLELFREKVNMRNLPENRYSVIAAEVSGNVKHAHTFEISDWGLGSFGECIYLGKNTLLYLFENIYIVDGAIIGDEYSDSVFIAIRHRGLESHFKAVSIENFENGELTLRIDYFSALSTDDAMGYKSDLIEIDKAAFNGEKITSVNFILNGEMFFIQGYGIV